MEDLLTSFWGVAATVVEGAAALLIAIGAAEAFAMSLMRFRAPTAQKMQIWMHFATWLLLGLEFEPPPMSSAPRLRRPGRTLDNWLQSPQSARFLAYFLDKDIEKVSDSRKGPYQNLLQDSGPLGSTEAPAS